MLIKALPNNDHKYKTKHYNYLKECELQAIAIAK